MKPANWDVRIYFVDRGSTDGTSEAIGSLGLNVKISFADSSCSVARAMHQAEQSIDHEYDVCLWLNDHVVVFQDTYKRLEEFRLQYPSSILIPQLGNPETGELTSGGYELTPGVEFRCEHKYAERLPVDIDTFDSNLVLIPQSAANSIGSVNPDFTDFYSGIDYGLRAKRKRIRAVALPGFFGTCQTAPVFVASNRRDALRHLHSTIGQPISQQIQFLVRHASWRWPINLLVPYLRILFNKTA